jgi:molybdopterin converting factor subunit 1
MTAVSIQYYAILREQAGTSRETLQTNARDAAELYDELRERHGFTLSRSQLRVAINGEFSDWDHVLADGHDIVFIPPVAGG